MHQIFDNVNMTINQTPGVVTETIIHQFKGILLEVLATTLSHDRAI